ncbi:hypothetical protein ACVJGD_001966 [Bradyrhizobium sp. USDA 10063]
MVLKAMRSIVRRRAKTDPATGKQRTGWLGVYNPETFTVGNGLCHRVRCVRCGCVAVG